MKNNGTLKLISLIVTIFVILMSVSASYVQTRERVDTIKVEGCLPARKNTLDIIQIKTDIKYIRKNTDEIKNALKE